MPSVLNLDEALVSVSGRPAAYVLRPVGGQYLYKGACRDLARRLGQHHSGCVRHTKNKRPLELVYFEYVSDFAEAQHLERFLKSGTGRDFLKAYMAGRVARVAEWQTQRT